MVCVAPKRDAHSSFCGMTSTAMIFAAPASTPPCTQFSPMPPTPNTAMVAPDSTLARLITAPKPVMMPQPISAARSKGTRGSIGMAPCSRTSVRSVNTEALANWKAGLPPTGEGLRSPSGSARCGTRVGRPTSQALQRPQCDRVDTITVSPSFTAVTPGPTASIDARALVAEHHRRRVRDGAVDDAEVGVAEAGGLERDAHLAGARGAQLDLLDGDGPIGGTKDGGLHVLSPSGCRRAGRGRGVRR